MDEWVKNHQDGEASADPIGSFLYVYMIVVDFFFCNRNISCG